jgi:chemotaxis protein CheY-P-specific phosphatase CheC
MISASDNFPTTNAAKLRIKNFKTPMHKKALAEISNNTISHSTTSKTLKGTSKLKSIVKKSELSNISVLKSVAIRPASTIRKVSVYVDNIVDSQKQKPVDDFEMEYCAPSTFDIRILYR